MCFSAIYVFHEKSDFLIKAVLPKFTLDFRQTKNLKQTTNCTRNYHVSKYGCPSQPWGNLSNERLSKKENTFGALYMNCCIAAFNFFHTQKEKPFGDFIWTIAICKRATIVLPETMIQGYKSMKKHVICIFSIITFCYSRQKVSKQTTLLKRCLIVYGIKKFHWKDEGPLCNWHKILSFDLDFHTFLG